MTGALRTSYVEFVAADVVPPNMISFVEPLARRLCRNAGLDPDARVKLAVLASPMTADNRKVVDPETRIVASIVPHARCWMRYAPQAVDALVGERL
jgi:hypothetical protein